MTDGGVTVLTDGVFTCSSVKWRSYSTDIRRSYNTDRRRSYSRVTVLMDVGVTVQTLELQYILTDGGITVLTDGGVTVLTYGGVTVLTYGGVTVLTDGRGVILEVGVSCSYA